MVHQRLCDVGEEGFLRQLQAHLASKNSGRFAHVAIGMGDDAAILTGVEPGCVVCSDMLVEDVDFKRIWAGPSDIGHKAAAVNLSDLAAMGAEPQGLLASLAVDPEAEVRDVLMMLASLHELGCAHGAPLIGGDLSKTRGPWMLNVTAIGRLDPRQAMRRHQAHVGDLLFVTGALGAAAAGLEVLERGIQGFLTLAQRQKRPTAHTQLGRLWAQAGCIRSATDVSDGIQKDVAHLLPEGLGAQIQLDTIPIASEALLLAQRIQQDPRVWALAGGEDFELLVAAAPEQAFQARRCAQAAGVCLTHIGQVTAGPSIQFGDGQNPLAVSAYDHFAR